MEKWPTSEVDWFEALIRLARYLRSSEGCPWDREQNAESFALFLREEVAELLQALSSGDDAHAREEFGDVLFCLLASVASAEEEGRFTLKEALEGIHEKMIRRHGHVFGDETADSPAEVEEVWRRAKEAEKTRRRER